MRAREDRARRTAGAWSACPRAGGPGPPAVRGTGTGRAVRRRARRGKIGACVVGRDQHDGLPISSGQPQQARMYPARAAALRAAIAPWCAGNASARPEPGGFLHRVHRDAQPAEAAYRAKAAVVHHVRVELRAPPRACSTSAGPGRPAGSRRPCSRRQDSRRPCSRRPYSRRPCPRQLASSKDASHQGPPRCLVEPVGRRRVRWHRACPRVVELWMHGVHDDQVPGAAGSGLAAQRVAAWHGERAAQADRSSARLRPCGAGSPGSVRPTTPAGRARPACSWRR